MAKKKTTVYVDEVLWRATKIVAARSGRRDYQVFEEALRHYLSLQGVDTVWARSELNEEDALRLAYQEVHADRE